MTKKIIAADWFAMGRSKRVPATLWVSGNRLRIVTEDNEQHEALISEIKVSSRMANIPRELSFPNSGMAVVKDNDLLDQIIKTSKQRSSNWAYLLETKWNIIALCTIVGLAFIYVVWAHGIPTVTDFIAKQIPVSFLQRQSKEVYEQLQQEGVLTDSHLSQDQAKRVEQLFATIAPEYELEAGIKLRYQTHRVSSFSGGSDVANAFAFPDGLIVITDKLVTLLNDDELIAVFVHEVGHVAHRHGMRSVVRAAGISALLLLLGDYSGVSAVPALLVNLKYSRDFEQDADCFAAAYLKKAELPLSLIGEALLKMENSSNEKSPEKDNDEKSDKEKSADKGLLSGEYILELLSTHPRTQNRVSLEKVCPAL